MQDIEAALVTKAAGFTVDKLAMFAELCRSNTNTIDLLWDGGHAADDLEELQERATDASFAELLARLKADQRDFFKYVSDKSKAEGSRHVMTVLHLQAQHEKGLALATSWMENKSLVVNTQVGKCLKTSTDAFVRRIIKSSADVDPNQIYHICWCDWSKLGRLRQMDVNEYCDLVKAILSAQPERSCCLMLAPLLVSDSVIGGLRGESRPFCNEDTHSCVPSPITV